MTTQIDSLVSTVNGIVEYNTENINELVKIDVITSWLGVIVLCVLLFMVLIGLSYIFYLLFEEPISTLRYNRKQTRVRKLAGELLENPDTQVLLEKKTLRKYVLRDFVFKSGIENKYVDEVTNYLWYEIKYNN
jgi:hypothetical protein